jgi:hypothetical protein
MEAATISIEEEWYRLIPSRFPPVNVYERLGSASLIAAAQRLEDLTNPRLAAKRRLMESPALGQISPYRVQNWNHAPFAYLNPEGTHWLSPAFGALDLAKDPETALIIAIERREAFLKRTHEKAIDLDMRLLMTEVAGKFANLENHQPISSAEERRAIGQKVYLSGSAGILYRRADACSGRCVSVFRGDVLGKSTQSTHYKFVWDGKSITSVYNFTTGDTFRPGEIRAVAAERWAA